MWLIVFIVAIALVVVGAVYMIGQISRFSAINRIVEKNKLAGSILSSVIIASVFLIICYTMSVVDGIVVFLSTLMFFLLFGIIGKVVKKYTGKDYKGNLWGLLAVITSVIYLGVSFYLCNNVWETTYNIHTDKAIGKLKIAMFADSHLGTTFDGDGFAEKMKTIEEQAPDVLLIAGDMVDDSTKKVDIQKACNALGKLKIKYGVWFSFGNHDEGYYNGRDFTGQELREILKSNGVHVLEDECSLIDDRFYIVGRLDKGYDSRKSIDELITGLDTDKYIIVIDHQPNDYANEAATAADLVVSGHTHGGQLIPITYLGEWFGVNDMTYGYKKLNETNFIVTSGISDWAIRFKSGTKSEYVIINVEE
ncbi:metallophosphoesterase [Butyrivibrio sp. AE3004]|uniref:metallophosphoesterase n=1 Tax=Butyrivibrio sp. AE3004 TaxID=1506994 RepID=UPI000493F42F|nr:metallophosphoesterase [Butyrivibrio sp. AE3004]